MRTLVRSVGRASIGGEPLPSSFKAFEANKIIIRRSEVSMFAGAPGAGKSTLAWHLHSRLTCQRCTYQQIPMHIQWLCV
jgi:ABC-type multidrug transport system ATPase subunit